jgi:hypothetical protein
VNVSSQPFAVHSVKGEIYAHPTLLRLVICMHVVGRVSSAQCFLYLALEFEMDTGVAPEARREEERGEHLRSHQGPLVGKCRSSTPYAAHHVLVQLQVIADRSADDFPSKPRVRTEKHVKDSASTRLPIQRQYEDREW